MNLRAGVLLIVCIFVTMPEPCEGKATPVQAGLLSIVPGLGQVANGNTLEGVAWFVTSVGLVVVPHAFTRHAGFNIWMYNTYDAYRDAGAKDASHYNVFQNYIASFNPLNIVDPIGAPLVGISALSKGRSDRNKGTPRGFLPRVAWYSFTGMGEEGAFRGFLFPAFSDAFSSRWLGAITSSVIFSAAHLEFSPAPLVIRTALGMLFCWQTYLQDYDLRHSIFAHTWWDVLVTRKGGTKSELDMTGVLGLKFRL